MVNMRRQLASGRRYISRLVEFLARARDVRLAYSIESLDILLKASLVAMREGKNEGNDSASSGLSTRGVLWSVIWAGKKNRACCSERDSWMRSVHVRHTRCAAISVRMSISCRIDVTISGIVKA